MRRTQKDLCAEVEPNLSSESLYWHLFPVLLGFPVCSVPSCPHLDLQAATDVHSLLCRREFVLNITRKMEASQSARHLFSGLLNTAWPCCDRFVSLFQSEVSWMVWTCFHGQLYWELLWLSTSSPPSDPDWNGISALVNIILVRSRLGLLKVQLWQSPFL